ncbi:MAG: hypothetical protein WCE68_04010 [Anaerolineales bacterium]
MDTPSEKYEPNYGDRSGPFLAVWRTLRGLIRRLAGFLTITDEERSEAGIYTSGEGRD